MPTFKVMGSPVPQARPRAFRVGNSVRVYDPKTSKDWKNDVKWQVIEQMKKRGLKALDGPIGMSLFFMLRRPQGHYGKRGLRPSAPVHHTKTPDLDNLAKAVKDALSSICYRDDKQIVDLIVRKRYGEEPGVLIKIEAGVPF